MDASQYRYWLGLMKMIVLSSYTLIILVDVSEEDILFVVRFPILSIFGFMSTIGSHVCPSYLKIAAK